MVTRMARVKLFSEFVLVGDYTLLFVESAIIMKPVLRAMWMYPKNQLRMYSTFIVGLADFVLKVLIKSFIMSIRRKAIE